MFAKRVSARRTVFRALTGAVACWTVVASLVSPAHAQSNASYDQLRDRLVDEILVPGGIRSPRVLDAIRKTPRHEFVASQHRKNAYYDMALPIGDKQTISSPFIVAYMTQSLDPQPTDRVLEIGTGSGYQAAVLSPLVESVYSIEIVESLGIQSQITLKRLKYANVHTKIGDGFQGWAERAPFHKIIVTCSPEKVPQPLVDQLAEGGLMVIPVGERYQQILYLYRKKDGKLVAEALRPTLFVPMTGRAEDTRQVQPDPNRPSVVNGTFESPPESPQSKEKYVPGWYYEQQAKLVSDGAAPEGRSYVQFENREPGRSAHILQGFAINGARVHNLRVSVQAKVDQVVEGPNRDELPCVAISFYDGERREVGRVWLGPFRGTQAWHLVQDKLSVPPTAKEGILRVGLFGATGVAAFDDLKMTVE